MIVDFLLLPFICLIEGTGKLFRFIWRGGIFFIKWSAIIGFVPLWDLGVIVITLFLWVLCKLFHQRTPKLKWGKYLMGYPSWSYV